MLRYCCYCRRRAPLTLFAPYSDTALDGVIIRIELDPGFRLYSTLSFNSSISMHVTLEYSHEIRPERQYGRGMSGGQVRDEKRINFDPSRGGLGRQAEKVILYCW